MTALDVLPRTPTTLLADEELTAMLTLDDPARVARLVAAIRALEAEEAL